jgi:plasmid stability protein
MALHQVVEALVAKLTVRNLDEVLVRRLHARAAEAGISVEELHRRILQQALEPTGADIALAFRRLGELGLVLEPDKTTDHGRPLLEF